MNPAVFLTKPDDGGVKTFIRNARPSIRRWVKNHYEHFRMQFPPPPDGFPGSHQIQPGNLLYHHLFGEFTFNEITSPDHNSADRQRYPLFGEDWWDSILSSDDVTRGLFLDGQVQESEALQADLESGGMTTYFLLPSLAKMLTDNIRLGQASVNDIVNFFADTIMTFEGQQGKHDQKAPAVRPSVFLSDPAGYLFFHQLHRIFTQHPDFRRFCDEAGINYDAFDRGRDAAQRRFNEFDEDGDLYGFRDFEPKDFKEGMKMLLQPLLSALKAPFPAGQRVMLLKNTQGRKGINRLSDDVKAGLWEVVSSSRKDNKPIRMVLRSVVDPSVTLSPNQRGLDKPVNINEVFIPAGENDLRNERSGNNPALPLLEVFAESFFLWEHMNTIAMSKINHSRFTRDHFLDYDGTKANAFQRGGDGSVFFGDWFIDARTDHMVAFYANMWAANTPLRKSLESLFTGDNFAFGEITWYTEIISRHMSPVLIPKMQEAGIPSQVIYQIPGIESRQILQPQKVDFRLEAPLLRDAYLAYSQQFNDWFSQLLIGANRGYLYAEPYGPKGPGGKEPEKKIKSARESMRGAVKEAWSQVKGSANSLKGLEIPERDIMSAIQVEVERAHRNYNFTRPSLPPSGMGSLSDYLTFISSQYAENPEVLAAASTALQRLLVQNTSSIEDVEKMFMSDIKKHMQMKALGTVRFPALATALNVLRGYVIVPSSQLNEFVARQLTDDIRDTVRARARVAEGFTQRPEPAVVPPEAPPILPLRRPTP